MNAHTKTQSTYTQNTVFLALACSCGLLAWTACHPEAIDEMNGVPAQDADEQESAIETDSDSSSDTDTSIDTDTGSGNGDACIATISGRIRFDDNSTTASNTDELVKLSAPNCQYAQTDAEGQFEARIVDESLECRLFDFSQDDDYIHIRVNQPNAEIEFHAQYSAKFEPRSTDVTADYDFNVGSTWLNLKSTPPRKVMRYV